MYNLILAKTFAGTWNVSNLTTAGRVSLSKIDKNSARVALTSSMKGAFDLVLGRPADKGGAVILPLNTHDLKVTRGEYKAPTTYTASMKVDAIDDLGEVSLVITKKGIPFNERATWTISFPVVKTMSPAEMAQEIVDRVNASTSAHGIEAAVDETTDDDFTLTFEATEPAVSYTIQGADLLLGYSAEVSTDGVEGYGTVDQIKKIASMAAADAGFEYTYQDGATLLYPEYPLNPLRAEDSADEGFTVITIRCGEPRATKTHDEVVYQTVFVVFPSSADVDSFVELLTAVGELTSERTNE